MVLGSTLNEDIIYLQVTLVISLFICFVIIIREKHLHKNFSNSSHYKSYVKKILCRQTEVKQATQSLVLNQKEIRCEWHHLYL